MGKLHGTIRVYFNDPMMGLKFEGQYRDGKPHGVGIKYREDGTGEAEFEGQYEDGSVRVK